MSRKGRTALTQRTQHRSGSFVCEIPAYIRVNPSSEERHLDDRHLDPGETVELTEKTVMQTEKDGTQVVYAMTSDGGWVRIERDGDLVVRPIQISENESNAFDVTCSIGTPGTPGTPGRGDDTSSIGTPGRGRSNIRSSTGGKGPQRDTSPSSRSGGKFLPITTAEEIENERTRTASISVEALKRKSDYIGEFGMHNEMQDGIHNDLSEATDAEAARRKSSVTLVNEMDGTTSLANESRCKLVARLGESNFLAKKSDVIHNKLDALALLMQRQVQLEMVTKKNKETSIRFQ